MKLKIRQAKMGAYAQLALVVGGFILLCVLFPPLGQFVLDIIETLRG